MDYLPSREADLRGFAVNFSNLTSATPADYALTAGDAAQIKAAVDEFVAAFDLVQNPATQTIPNTIAKNAAKGTLLAILRGYGMVIKANRSVSDQQKADLRLLDSDAASALGPVRVTAPNGRPLINVVAVDALRHELHFSDPENTERRAKPEGVLGLQLFRHVGEVPASPRSCEFVSFVSGIRSTMKLDYDASDAGKTAYYFARWQTRTGLVGPWSLLASRMIAA